MRSSSCGRGYRLITIRQTALKALSEMPGRKISYSDITPLDEALLLRKPCCVRWITKPDATHNSWQLELATLAVASV